MSVRHDGTSPTKAARPPACFLLAAGGLTIAAALVVWMVVPNIMLIFERDPQTAVLTHLRDDINRLYGQDANGTTRINCGPCTRFAIVFRDEWQARFGQSPTLVLVLSPDQSECGHVMLKLPEGRYFDGGNGVLTERHFRAMFPDQPIEEMAEIDLPRLDKLVGGIHRPNYPLCPNYSDKATAQLVRKHPATLPSRKGSSRD